MEELSDLHKRGNTIIMVTHNPRLTTYASRVIKMTDGTIETDTHIDEPPHQKQKKRPLGKRKIKVRRKKGKR